METEQIKRIHEKIEGVDKDFKEHCKSTDARFRELEGKTVKHEVLTEQFTKAIEKQSTILDNLSASMSSLDRTVSSLKTAFEDLYKKNAEREQDICDVKKETAEKIQNIAEAVKENERLHTIDLREVSKEESKSFLEKMKPYAIATGILGAIGSIMYVGVQILQVLESLSTKIP